MPTTKNLPYWRHQEKPLKDDLSWNFPERKSNSVAVIGGNSNNFSHVIKISELLSTKYPLETVSTILPDALKSKIPPALLNISFAPSTPSGSFAKSQNLKTLLDPSDFILVDGDLSKNPETASALTNAILDTSAPVLLTRDAIDLLSPEMETLISRENLFLLASAAQLQKIFRALYYPRVFLLSSPLLTILETLHKFTLTYDGLTLITFHSSDIIIAKKGEIITVPIKNTPYSPISLWSGPLAASLLVYNLWNPGHSLDASTSAVLAKQ